MANDAVVTVRIPVALKRRIERLARGGRRSLSAQVLHDLESLHPEEPTGARDMSGRFLGLYSGTPVASDAHILDVRARLWGRLATRRRD